MKPHLFRKLSIMAGMALVASLSPAPPARADLVVTYAEDLGAVTAVILAPGSPGSPPGLSGATSFNTPDFQVVIQGGQAFQNSPNSPTTQLLGSTTSITNSDGGIHTLHLVLYASGYTSPVIPPPAVLASQLGGSVTTGGAGNVLAYQSYVNTGTTGTPTGITPGPQTANITATNSSYNTGSATTLVSSLGTPFELVQVINITLSGGSVINYSSSTTLTTATPEPATIALAFAGLPVLGLHWVRRRRAGA